jgi:signal transduction histidine kinase
VFRVVAGIAGAQMLLGGALLYADPTYPRWRVALALLLGAATLPLAFLGTRVQRSALPSWLSVATPVAATLVFGGMMAVVEGPTSPMSPLLLHAVVGQAARRGVDRATRATLAAAIAVLVLLALGPRTWFGPSVAEPQRTWLWLTMLGGVLVSLAVEVSSIRRAYGGAKRQLDSMREAILRDHAARTRGLETIGAKVAHELKNPLTSIKALLQIMGEDAAEDESARRRHEVLEGEVARMQSILQDYLSFSRPLDELRTSRVELQGLAEHVAAVLEARALDAGVALKVNGDPVTITGDEERLRAALLNVVGNALEATPQRGEVTITTRATDGGATILVRDTGRGMSERMLDKLGTPFFSTKSKGTGLGVVIATSTIRQHGGDLRYESREGEGTTATIELPSEALPSGDPARSYEKVAHPNR